MVRIGIFVSWLLVFVYGVVIFYFSCLPSKCVPQLFPFSDKVYHYIEYFPFGVLLVRAFWVTFKRLDRRALLLFLFVIVLYALSDEIHQLFVSGRFFSYGDILVDVLGAASGGFVYLWLR
ncbi:MAG TPA: teicoplanin resistance protein VanZ [Candidatus Omnitrophica bacterium]|nr:teicoplanin resistance protein VanZ [Candidatus Omnitrophota bacterium]